MIKSFRQNQSIEKQETLMICSLLDIHFKEFKFTTKENYQRATSYLKREYKQYKNRLQLKQDQDEIQDKLDQITFKKKRFVTIYGNLESEEKTNLNSTQEVTSYLFIKQIEIEDQSLSHEWWQKNKEIYPILFQIAKDFLSIPATSVESERVFSSAGFIANEKRSKLTSSNLDQLLFLLQNNKYFN